MNVQKMRRANARKMPDRYVFYASVEDNESLIISAETFRFKQAMSVKHGSKFVGLSFWKDEYLIDSHRNAFILKAQISDDKIQGLTPTHYIYDEVQNYESVRKNLGFRKSLS